MGKGLLIIVSAPAGCGKDTVIEKLISGCSDIYYSVSATTRPMRKGELDGKSYYFISHGRFKEMIDSNDLLEYAEYVGNYYGTPKSPVLENMSAGKDVVLKIEVEGAKNVKNLFSDCVLIFLLPPSFQELERRLRLRGTEDEFAIASRILKAREEIKEVYGYDYAVVNDDLETAVDEIKSIIKAEKLSVKRGVKSIE
ncbi:MAG: guanylate kinase [Eubacterium sp.]|jgi:guanylate kinase|nr:guanylate kinase [Eubacterium sp.]